ncbi:hypothetical protein [Thauera sp.]|uniref:hypothetical protein n=1 Tax=Thauera sp. TaxID=1905334 RepID=UPI0039E3E922
MPGFAPRFFLEDSGNGRGIRDHRSAGGGMANFYRVIWFLVGAFISAAPMLAFADYRPNTVWKASTGDPNGYPSAIRACNPQNRQDIEVRNLTSSRGDCWTIANKPPNYAANAYYLGVWVYIAKECTYGGSLNGAQNMCVNVPDCPNGQVRNATTGRCEVPPPPTCDASKTIGHEGSIYTGTCFGGCGYKASASVNTQFGSEYYGPLVGTGQSCEVGEGEGEPEETQDCTPTGAPPDCSAINGSPYYQCGVGWTCIAKQECPGSGEVWTGRVCKKRAPCDPGWSMNSIGQCARDDDGSGDGGDGGDDGGGGDTGGGDDGGGNDGGDTGGGDDGGGGDTGGGDDGSGSGGGGGDGGGSGDGGNGGDGGGNNSGNGDGNGNGDNQGNGKSKWGASCGGNVMCQGDAIMCAIARMDHERKCRDRAIENDAESVASGNRYMGAAKGISDEDAARALNKDGAGDFDLGEEWEKNQKEWVDAPVAAACIHIDPIEVLGATIDIDASPLCSVADFVRVLLHIIAYMNLIRLVVKE